MNRIMNAVIAILLGIIFLLASGVFYIVDETQQAVVTQFGEPIGQPLTRAGLYFKIPLIQQANYFEKRILEWDGDPNQIPTRDKRYIWVDATARWRITDALKFMQSFGTESAAQSRLDDIVDANTRDVISNAILVEAVRDSNRLLEEVKNIRAPEDLEWESLEVSLERIEQGREKLTREILRRSKDAMQPYGVELIDVQLKRINYVQEVRKKVYERMISERKRAAEKYRSEGQGEKASIEGQMIKELEQIRSEAYRTAQEIKGKADAEATAIYAQAYNKDPDFFKFLKTMDTYKSTVGSSSTIFLTTDSDLYKYLKGLDHKPSLP